MAKQSGGSLPKGRRRRDEVPPIPPDSALSGLQRTAQAVLVELVEAGGGRFGSTTPVAIGGVDVLTDLFDAWGRDNSQLVDGRRYFNGRPGLWHALDELCPLQDPNRWDALRQVVIVGLEARGWQRAAPPRGAAFYLPR
jgi:hypothetical protein